MSKSTWKMFRIAFVVFVVMMMTFLARKRVFDEIETVILSLVGVMFALLGVALYVYIRNRAEDININWSRV